MFQPVVPSMVTCFRFGKTQLRFACAGGSRADSGFTQQWE